MNITKKAVSVGLTATMLASLLATAVAGTAFAAVTSSPTTTTVPANGVVTSIPSLTLTLAAPGDMSGTGTLTFTAPTGFSFDCTTAPTVSAGATGATIATPATCSAATLTTAVSVAPTAAGTITVSGVKVKSTTSSASGNIVATYSGTMSPASVVVATLNATTSTSVSATCMPYIYAPSSVPADGASTIQLAFTVGTCPSGSTATISTSAGKFISTTLTVSPTPTFPTASLSGVTFGSGTLTLQAPSTAGSATISVLLVPSFGTATYDSLATITFTAATLPTVSTNYSFTTAPSSLSASPAGSTGQSVTTTVRDPNNSPITTGATVTWTLSPLGYFAGGSNTASTSTNGSGVATSPLIYSTGVVGKTTLTTSISYLGVTYTLANATITFVGAPAKIVLSNNYYSLTTAGTPTSNALLAVVTDAAGNAIKAGLTFSVGAYTPANIFTITPGSYSSTDGAWDIAAACSGTPGRASVTVTVPSGSSTITSNAAWLTCADPLGATTLGTFTVSAATPLVAPNGTDKISVSVQDDNGLPAVDGTTVSAYTNNVGAVVSGGVNPNAASTSNGVATFTYLAPSNAASATVTVFVGNTTTGSAAVTLTIGTPAPPVAYTAASALGVTTSGPFTAATKLPKLGQYITVKFSLGAAAAGKIVTIYEAARTPANTTGTWGAFHGLTTRIADANGNVYFYWKSTSAAWLSFYAGLNGAYSNSSQARWM